MSPLACSTRAGVGALRASRDDVSACGVVSFAVCLLEPHAAIGAIATRKTRNGQKDLDMVFPLLWRIWRIWRMSLKPSFEPAPCIHLASLPAGQIASPRRVEANLPGLPVPFLPTHPRGWRKKGHAGDHPDATESAREPSENKASENVSARATLPACSGMLWDNRGWTLLARFPP